MNLTRIMTLILSPIYGVGLSAICSFQGIELDTELIFFNSIVAVFFAFCTSWAYSSWRDQQLNPYQ